MIRVTSKGVHTATEAAHHYALADQPVVFETKVDALEAHYVGPASERFSELLRHFSEPPILTAANSTLSYFGDAPFAGQMHQVRYWRHKHRAQFDIDHIPFCQIDFNENHIHLLNDHGFDDAINLEVVTGPAMVLLLAEVGVFCLHAGCVATSAGNIAIIAESGAGKSTLSAHVDASWTQITDDILPVQYPYEKSSDPLLLPNYPQLKLPKATVSVRPKAVMKLDSIVRVNPEPGSELVIKEIGRRDAMLQIIRHTVGTKLFEKTVMERHAKFARELSQRVPVLEFTYPRVKEELSSLRKKIVDEFTRRQIPA